MCKLNKERLSFAIIGFNVSSNKAIRKVEYVPLAIGKYLGKLGV